ncbi:MAG TPA: hypothetical protein VND22_00820 [Actinomycetota bacterium]|nr:hypothetical protein [Actinomycetota bacterium]
MATARNRDRTARASKAQIGSLKRRVQTAGKQLEQEQEESVLSLARALGEINEGEATAYLDSRLAAAEREIERLTEEREEMSAALDSEMNLMKVRMQAALEAVGVGPNPEEQGTMADEIRASIVADVQETLSRAGDHFTKRFAELEDRWTKTMVDMTSGVDALLKRMAVLERGLSERAEATDHFGRLERSLAQVESRLAEVEVRPATAGDQKQLDDVKAWLNKIQVAVELLAGLVNKKSGNDPGRYLTRMEALERTVGHLVSWSELHSPSLTEIQGSIDKVLRSVSSLESQTKNMARRDQVQNLETEVAALPGVGLRMQAIEARLDKTEGPLAAMTSQIYTKLSELLERMEALEVRAAFATDILPQRRRR